MLPLAVLAYEFQTTFHSLVLMTHQSQLGFGRCFAHSLSQRCDSTAFDLVFLRDCRTRFNFFPPIVVARLMDFTGNPYLYRF
jgi:hypothetical protein